MTEPNPVWVDGKWTFDPSKPVHPPTEVNVFDQDRMEDSEPLTTEEQGYYNQWADELGKDCPNPDCICKKGNDG